MTTQSKKNGTASRLSEQAIGKAVGECVRLLIFGAIVFVVGQMTFQSRTEARGESQVAELKRHDEKLREHDADISLLRLLPSRIDRLETRLDQGEVRAERTHDLLIALREIVIRLETRMAHPTS